MPNSVWGLDAALKTINARTPESKLGMPGDPTQHNIDQLMKEFKGLIKTKRKDHNLDMAILSKAEEVLKARGMI